MNAEMEKPRGLRDYLAAAKYRRVWLWGTFGAGLVATILLALLLPPHFRSAGTILIEQQEMPQELVRSTVTSYADERVQVISKRVMTTETMLGIIKRYDLYPKERAKDTREALLAQMRKDIGLKMISADVIDPRSGHPTSATIAFDVSYTSVSPDLAAKVANELTTLYLNENLSNRTQLARDATTFLEAEGDRLNKRIGELEAELEKFKEKHFKQLPEQTQLNMQLLDRTQDELRELESRKSSLEQQRVFLEAQLVQLKPNSVVFSETGERIVSSADRLKQARSQLDSARALYSPDHPDVIRLEREVEGLQKDVDAASAATGSPSSAVTASEANDLQRRLDAAKSQLAEARERYGPEHPDRVRLEREVQTLASELAAAPPPPPATPKLSVKQADNPAYVQIQAELSATINDLDSLTSQAAKLHALANSYTNDVSLAPQVEQQYRELTRDYDNTRLKYAEIRSKSTEAKTAQDLEADRKGERFTLIEPPLPPEEPVSPNRRMIFIAGVVLSAGLAFGVLWLLESMDTSVRGRLDLLKLTGVAPLALVPPIGTESEQRAHRRRVRLAIGTGMASVCIAVALTHFFYQPLDVLWFTFARRMGL
jgi:succinoglycan biosynthesis transport protein ExoP